MSGDASSRWVRIWEGCDVESGQGWSGVRERVVAMIEARNRAWGRGPVRWQIFEPTLSAEEVAEVEEQCGVALPDEYRTFLLEVGAGGPGPAIELTSLRRIGGRWGWVWDDDENWPGHLDASRPFVETNGWRAQQEATLRAAGHEPGDHDPEMGYRKDYESAFGDKGEGIWHLERVHGAVQISDNGCGMTGWLILVGPHRGELRDRDCGYDPPFDPYVDASGQPHNFRTWYLEWLEKEEAEVQRLLNAGE